MKLREFRLEKKHARLISKSTLFKTLKWLDDEDVQTPLLLIDTDKVSEKLSMMGKKIKNARLFYAVKANPDINLARFVSERVVGFEISSEGELNMLAEIGVKADRIISSNPVKSLTFLEKAYSYGINQFAYDSFDEAEKIAKLAPRSNVYVRLAVPNEGSEWPLSRKFGAELDDAVQLLVFAQEKELNPVGITFHVGSQCTDLYSWNIALDKAKILWDIAEQKKIKLQILNIGGGYPVNYTRNVLDIDTIEKNIDKLIREKFPEDIEVHMEPGRAVVGDAGMLVTTVIGKAKRRDEDWLYIDVGVFNGLMESLGGIRYTYLVESYNTSAKEWTIAGPSCDGFDVIDKNVRLWEPDIGNLLLVLSGGAYTVSYASEFNGFSIPNSVLI
jgi:ornithine decarboxylase